jgi:hypothetical protein
MTPDTPLSVTLRNIAAKTSVVPLALTLRLKALRRI